jgi:hypothetical protein
MVRAVSVINGLLVYALAARLFGRTTGVVASVLALTSATVQIWSAKLLLDHVQPGFVLAMLLALAIALEDRRLGLFVFSGVLAGAAFLTKESAAVLLPVPLLACSLVPRYRSRPLFTGLAAFYLVSGLLVTSWLVHVDRTAPEDRAIGSRSSQVARVVLGGDRVAGADGAALAGPPQHWAGLLGRYYAHYVRGALVLPLIFPLVWAGLAGRALVFRCRASCLLLIVLSCFAPIVLFLGAANLRLGQNLLPVLLFYVGLAALLTPPDGSRLQHPRLFFLRWTGIAVYLGLQLFSPRVGLQELFETARSDGLVKRHGVYSFALTGRSWRVSGWHDEAIQDAARWFLEKTDADEPILMDWYQADSLFFFLGGRQPVSLISFDTSKRIDYSFMAPKKSFDRFPPQPLLFLWMQAGRTGVSHPDTWMNALCEPRLLGQIEEQGIRYVVISPRRSFLYLYFAAQPGFDEAESFAGGRIVVFRRNERPLDLLESSSSFPMVGPGVASHLGLLARSAPGLERELSRRFLAGRLGLTPADIERLELGRYPQLEPARLHSRRNARRRRGVDSLFEDSFESGDLTAWRAPASP